MSGGNDKAHAPPPGVKAGGATESRKAQRGFRRHLEGWQAGVVAVGIAGLAALLVVPRPVAPDVLPVPRVDRRAQAAAAEARRALAGAASNVPLPFAVRAVGEAFRRVGRIAAGTEPGDGPGALRDLHDRVAEARKAVGDAPLLALRAFQTEAFLHGLEELEAGSDVPRDVIELGGDFATHLRAEPKAEARVPGPRVDVASAFVVRWSALTGLAKERAFAPSLNEYRASFRLRLTQQRRGDARDRARADLEAVRALERLDPEYPAALARGILALRLSEYRASAEALDAYLREHPSGPWTLRARNYFAAAASMIPPDDEM